MKTKHTVATLAAVCLLAFNAQAGSAWDTIGDFFAANPTNSFDLSAYGLKNLSTEVPGIANGLGGGARIGYWLTPSVGAALDVSYCESSWTFASLGLAGRGTFHVGSLLDVTPYVSAGPGWNIEATGLGQSIVAVAGGGATITITKWKGLSFFAEYTKVLTEKQQDRVQFGITKRF